MKYSFLVAIEKYHDTKKIRNVDYAENDLQEFKNAIKNIGYADEENESFLNSDATKTIIESKLKQLCSIVNKKNDEIIFYYAGHGFAKDGNNYITCYDSVYEDLESTSIPMLNIFDQLKNACDRVIFFFDSCHSGLTINTKMRGLFSDMNVNEFKQALNDNSYCVGFAACKSDEYSYPISRFKHGTWTYHLIECLNGHVPDVLEKKIFLTASALQYYLNKAVPRSIRENYTERSYKQTPWMFGGQEKEIILGDLSDILKKNSTPPPNIREVELRNTDYGRIRDLSGFQKGHHKVPTNVCSATMSFVSKISQGDLEVESAKIREVLRNELGYKRKEMEKSEDDYGFSFQTPDFTISVAIEQDKNDCSQYKQTVIMSNIDYDFIRSPKFKDVFTNYFDTLVLILDKTIDIGEFIDQIEDFDSEDVDLDYEDDLSECNLKIKGVDGTIYICPRAVRIEFSRKTSPQHMIESFIEMNNCLKELGNDQLLIE